MTTYRQDLSATFQSRGSLAASRRVEDFVRRNWWKAVALAILARVLLAVGKGLLSPDQAT
jgi:hypothetical protein